MQGPQQRPDRSIGALLALYRVLLPQYLRGVRRQVVDTITAFASAYLSPVWQRIKVKRGSAGRWIEVKRGGGPGWLRHEIDQAVKQAKRIGPNPPRSIRSAIAGPSIKTILVLGTIFLSLVGLSVFLSLWNPDVLGLAKSVERISIYTAMWQVQAGIAALALPVLLFVIERSRDERQAAVHSAEVLGRESWSFPIIGLSFVVVGRMGIDMSWFAENRLVFLSDVALFLLTLVAAIFAYYRVLQLILSPSRMRERSIALAQEKTRSVLMQSVRVRIGNNRLLGQVDRFGVDYWPFGTSAREKAHYLILDSPQAGYFVDLHVSEFETFVIRLPWLAQPARSAPEPSQPTPSEEPPDRSVWLLHRYGDLITEDDLGFIRLRRESFADFTDADKQVLEAGLRTFVRVSESDEF